MQILWKFMIFKIVQNWQLVGWLSKCSPKVFVDETFWLFFVSLEIDACILSPCPVNNLLSCEDLAPPHCGAATDRICHCNVGYTWAGEEQGCVNIDVCTTTVTQWNFDDCGSNTICKDEIGGPISTAGRTCECINDHYKPKCELSCERNYGSFCFFNGLFYLGLTFFFFTITDKKIVLCFKYFFWNYGQNDWQHKYEKF